MATVEIKQISNDGTHGVYSGGKLISATGLTLDQARKFAEKPKKVKKRAWYKDIVKAQKNAEEKEENRVAAKIKKNEEAQTKKELEKKEKAEAKAKAEAESKAKKEAKAKEDLLKAEAESKAKNNETNPKV